MDICLIFLKFKNFETSNDIHMKIMSLSKPHVRYPMISRKNDGKTLPVNYDI